MLWHLCNTSQDQPSLACKDRRHLVTDLSAFEQHDCIGRRAYVELSLADPCLSSAWLGDVEESQPTTVAEFIAKWRHMNAYKRECLLDTREEILNTIDAMLDELTALVEVPRCTPL